MWSERQRWELHPRVGVLEERHPRVAENGHGLYADIGGTGRGHSGGRQPVDQMLRSHRPVSSA